MKNSSHFKPWVVQVLPKIYSLFFLCCLSGVYAQNKTITGIVTDDNGALAGVSIILKSRPLATLTDEKGNYAIIAGSNDILVFSFMGYKSVEIAVTNHSIINVHLREDATTLKEVTINAGYYTVKEKESTGSIARITAKDIETQPVTNVLATMQGRMAGVSITQETGTPGGGFNIKIRGLNSLRTDANVPLYVIDGVPYASDPIGYSQTSSVFPNVTSPLNSIDPDAIESIEVLKDADATAIYGSRGANGVVLITTKKGKSGKTQFNFNASTGAGKATAFAKLMNTSQYLAMRKQAYANDGIPTYPANAYDTNGTWDVNRYTDWQKELMGGTASFSSLQGSVSGGTEQTQFLFGGNYKEQGTVYPADFLYHKGGVLLNLGHTSTDKRFRLTVAANYTVQNNNQAAADLTIDGRSLAPNAPALYDAEGNLNWENNTFGNPLRFLNAEHRSKTNDLIANTLVSYQIFSKLQIKSSFGYTDTNHTETRTSPSTINNPSFGITSESSALFVTKTARRSWIIEPQLNFSTLWGNGHLDALLGSTFQQQLTTRLSQNGIGFTSNGLIYDLASASIRQVFLSDEVVYKYAALFGRINYDWKQRYIINFTGRRDGSSRFGPENRFAFFGAVGTAWIFSKEAFLQNSEILSFGKLRASYGSTGNDQIGDYQFLNTYSSSGQSYQNVAGLQPTRLFNPEFSWETNKKLEAALELGFFNDRIMLTAATFMNKSSNQLVGIPLPGTTGFSSIQANLNAVVENTGLEFTLQTKNRTGTNFKWSTDFNISILKNKLVDFPDLEASTFSQRYRIGQPLNISLVYVYKGVNPVTGIYEFVDSNGDGQITFPEDKQKVVDLNPKFFGGLQNQLQYKNWNLSFLFQFVKQKNTNISIGAAGRRNYNQPVRFVDSWQQQGDSANYQKFTTGTNSQVMNAQTLYENSDAMIVDASFIRLKNISISYAIPLPRTAIKCKVYVEAQNLLTFTPYKDGDPEFIKSGFLPPLKMINSGVQFQF
ncbi:SusC/RagA family TonB-linked outer membrane protein [Flavobacterium muglaense]|uniref:SusC/RagA family TonB-linked outer membrane protein n=1 Tax=Flavobacterium muglaense TaxID=2764716 RepID=A0A923SEA6_9FLAO|nr:SusC/RagA family TonB-linked outer membrane protein [Flavobacterium muglaense]MBC5836708.1 SusC/RagA family TonB-linked outer membrane protein [Flavobacterium muglaense]MBC5843342.1 SusC/RagA family TonB-linked outer membrane protein [Flavobacterium muglaense]